MEQIQSDTNLGDQLLNAITSSSVDALKPMLDPILREEARKILNERLLSGAEAIREFGITKHDLPFIPTFQPTFDRNKKYQVKDIMTYIAKHKAGARKTRHK